MKPWLVIVFGLTALAAPAASPAPRATPGGKKDVPHRSFAQELVDRTAARHPELVSLEIHAKPPDGSDSVVVASTRRDRIGQKTAADDLQVLATGRHRIELGEANRLEVSLPLRDSDGQPVGIAKLSLVSPPSTEPAAVIPVTQRIRDELEEQIPSSLALFEAIRPVPDADIEGQQLPMTKAVVSGQVLEQSAQEGYSEAIKGVAGVAPANSKGSANDSIYIRGIKLNLFSNYRLNGGLSTAGVITVPTENKEKIETLKGANALMFGVASPAGIINLVTKRAGPKDINSVAVVGNAFGQTGGSADVGRRLGDAKQLGVRVNAAVARLQNGVRNTGGDNEFASLGLDWTVSPKLQLQGDLEYFRKHVPEQGGVSLLAVRDGVVPITPVPDPRNLLSARWAMLNAETTNFQVRGDYFFVEGWDVLAEVGRSYAHRSRFTVRIGGYDIVNGAGGDVRVNTVRQDYLNTFERVELVGNFATLFLGHRLAFGGSRSERDSENPYQNNAVLSQRQNIFNPIDLAEPNFNPNTAMALARQTSEEIGVYAYDTISIGRQWKVLAGLRFTRDKEDNGRQKGIARVNTPALGMLYDPVPGLTLFGSYMEGLEAGATAPVNAVNAYEIMPAAVSTQKEIGFRMFGFKGVSFSASGFQITRANAVTDPMTLVFAQNGDIEYLGVEGTVNLQLLREWNFEFTGQWMRAIQHAPDAQINDLVPENTPNGLGNIRVGYRPSWLKGLALTAGASGITRRYVNPQDQGRIPGYVLYLAGLGYQTRIGGKYRLAIQLNVDNLANLRYWNSVQTGTYGTGMDRSFKMSTRFDF
jgi:iron complex outermembrane receptor protein